MGKERHPKKRVITEYEKAETFYESFSYSASSLKQWLITFGIGVIALFISNLDVFENITLFWRLAVFILIIASLLLQVIITFINKISQYYLYLHESGYLSENSRKYRWAYDTACKFYLDCIFDVLSISFYIIAVGIIIYFISIK